MHVPWRTRYCALLADLAISTAYQRSLLIKFREVSEVSRDAEILAFWTVCPTLIRNVTSGLMDISQLVTGTVQRDTVE